MFHVNMCGGGFQLKMTDIPQAVLKSASRIFSTKYNTFLKMNLENGNFKIHLQIYDDNLQGAKLK